MKREKRIGLLVVSLLIAMLTLVGTVYAANVVVDDFEDGDWPEQSDSALCTSFFGANYQRACAGTGCSSCTPSQNTYDASSGVLGTERDLTATRESASGFVYLTIDFGDNGALNFETGSGGLGDSAVIWDGDEGDDSTGTRAGVISTTGLLGVDLTDGGTNEGFLLTVSSDDNEANLTLEVYSSTNVATTILALPGDIAGGSRVDVFVPFDSFSGAQSVFTSAGAVRLGFSTVAEAVDLTADLFEATTAREYGDLPSTYGASVLDAYHIPQTLRLGSSVDGESTANISSDTTGDDSDDFDDEDGVTPVGQWSSGTNGGTLEVTREGCAAITGGCYINGWIDWNGDGDFADALEHVIQNVNETTDDDVGEQYSFEVPTGFGGQYYYARFRICEGSTDCDDPDTTDTNVLNGEIEDYRWYWGPTAITLTDITARSTPTTAILIAAGVVGLGALAVLALARRRRLL
jgi:hypothetical protein